MSSRVPARGDIWFARLDPTEGHEQAGARPVLIVTSDTHNSRRNNLVVVLPLTAAIRSGRLRIPVAPPEGGLKVSSDILCDQVRAISQLRLDSFWGSVTTVTMELVSGRLRALLDLAQS